MEIESVKRDAELKKKIIEDEKENKIKAEKLAAQKAMQMKLKERRIAREKEATERKAHVIAMSVSNEKAIDDSSELTGVSSKMDDCLSANSGRVDADHNVIIDDNNSDANASTTGAGSVSVDAEASERYRVEQEAVYLANMEA